MLRKKSAVYEILFRFIVKDCYVKENQVSRTALEDCCRSQAAVQGETLNKNVVPNVLNVNDT